MNDDGSLHKKINHDNFPLNVYEYYSGKRKDANALSSGGIDGTWTGAGADASVKDRYHGIAMQNTLANVNSKPTIPSDNIISTYDESALSRCTLLFIGSLCQQGESCKFRTPFRISFTSCCRYFLKLCHHYYFHFGFFFKSNIWSTITEFSYIL